MKKLAFIFTITFLSYSPFAQPSAAFICTLWLNAAEKRKMELEKQSKQEQENNAPDSTLKKEESSTTHTILKNLQENNSTDETTA